VFKPHTVTFDCWQTLIYETHSPTQALTKSRVQILVERTGKDPDVVRAAFDAAWREHQRAWHRQIAFGSHEMTDHVLAALGVDMPPDRRAALVAELEDEMLDHTVVAIDGTRELLGALRSAGVRTALICDTGFSPGRVVRTLLDRVGLLEHLEVQIFSDEVRAPKPHPTPFRAALEGLAAPARGAIHVGDLRRSDVVGARMAGMGTVRFRGRNDDASEDRSARPPGSSIAPPRGAHPCASVPRPTPWSPPMPSSPTI
jgi:putative hydrolase of the HAD superfamily